MQVMSVRLHYSVLHQPYPYLQYSLRVSRRRLRKSTVTVHHTTFMARGLSSGSLRLWSAPDSDPTPPITDGCIHPGQSPWTVEMWRLASACLGSASSTTPTLPAKTLSTVDPGCPVPCSRVDVSFCFFCSSLRSSHPGSWDFVSLGLRNFTRIAGLAESPPCVAGFGVSIPLTTCTTLYVFRDLSVDLFSPSPFDLSEGSSGSGHRGTLPPYQDWKQFPSLNAESISIRATVASGGASVAYQPGRLAFAPGERAVEIRPRKSKCL